MTHSELKSKTCPKCGSPEISPGMHGRTRYECTSAEEVTSPNGIKTWAYWSPTCHIRQLESQLALARLACEAAIAYDNSIIGKAARGEVELNDMGAAYSDATDLDLLYADWQEKSKAALAAMIAARA